MAARCKANWCENHECRDCKRCLPARARRARLLASGAQKQQREAAAKRRAEVKAKREAAAGGGDEAPSEDRAELLRRSTVSMDVLRDSVVQYVTLQYSTEEGEGAEELGREDEGWPAVDGSDLDNEDLGR